MAIIGYGHSFSRRRLPPYLHSSRGSFSIATFWTRASKRNFHPVQSFSVGWQTSSLRFSPTHSLLFYFLFFVYIDAFVLFVFPLSWTHTPSMLVLIKGISDRRRAYVSHRRFSLYHLYIPLGGRYNLYDALPPHTVLPLLRGTAVDGVSVGIDDWGPPNLISN